MKIHTHYRVSLTVNDAQILMAELARTLGEIAKANGAYPIDEYVYDVSIGFADDGYPSVSRETRWINGS